VGHHYLSLPTIEKAIFSEHLHRFVSLSVILPPSYQSDCPYRLLLCNDGQDFAALEMASVLYWLQTEHVIEEIVVVGIHADHNRLQEYGTAVKPDYAQRGSLAAATTDFVINELLPFLSSEYNTQKQNIVYAGCSLGGLMALDIAWNHPNYFSRVAVFSGALWWRQKAIEDGYNNADRIMHSQIRSSPNKPNLSFWFQAGTLDESSDRDGDGVIDSIQDTLECIAELEQKGYRWGKDIAYVEVKSGQHNTGTWAAVMPQFLKWAFATRNG
jgi:iron(III)-enterobactin esterase